MIGRAVDWEQLEFFILVMKLSCLFGDHVAQCAHRLCE